jgi:hypothetical protein
MGFFSNILAKLGIGKDEAPAATAPTSRPQRPHQARPPPQRHQRHQPPRLRPNLSKWSMWWRNWSSVPLPTRKS